MVGVEVVGPTEDGTKLLEVERETVSFGTLVDITWVYLVLEFGTFVLLSSVSSGAPANGSSDVTYKVLLSICVGSVTAGTEWWSWVVGLWGTLVALILVEVGLSDGILFGGYLPIFRVGVAEGDEM